MKTLLEMRWKSIAKSIREPLAIHFKHNGNPGGIHWIFPQRFTWIWDGSPMEFQVISKEVLIYSRLFQFIPNGFHIDVRRISNGLRMDSNGFPTDR